MEKGYSILQFIKDVAEYEKHQLKKEAIAELQNNNYNLKKALSNLYQKKLKEASNKQPKKEIKK